MTSVIVHPAFKPPYATYYLEGVASIFGRGFRFSTTDFPRFAEPLHGIAAAVHKEGSTFRLYISAGDRPDVDPTGLEWCDAFGKVNLDDELVPEHHAHKVVPIGPSFGVRFWGPAAALATAMRTYRMTQPQLREPWRDHLGRFWGQFRGRLPEHAYVPRQSDPGYVFFASRSWRHHPEPNVPRAHFIRVCKAMAGIRFEGGLAPDRHGGLEGYEDVTAPRRYPIGEYVEKTRRSALVFNTPAVHDCHGWKLGEFLALGKAIVSTPLSHTMPAPLRHTEHAHFTDAHPQAIREAVEVVAGDQAYRARLEQNARAYYEEFLRPHEVIRRMLRVAGAAVPRPQGARDAP